MRTINVRTQHSESWQYGPALCPMDFEMLLNLYCPGEYNCYSSDTMDYAYYEVPTDGMKRIIDALETMSEEEYKDILSFEDEEWFDAKDSLIADLQFLYDERDMTESGGEMMVLGWF